MISFFPDPYPDELLYSICARYQDRVRYPTNTATLEELFGPGSAAASIDLPKRLNYLIATLPPGHRYTVDQLIDEHTLLPFYYPFLPHKRQLRIREDMKGKENSTIHGRIGIMSSKVKQPEWLKFCPVCVQEDRKQFGETYWHRVHQVTSVEVCPAHAVFLQNSHVRARQRENNYKFVAAENVNFNTRDICKLNFLDICHKSFFKLATNTHWLLSNHNLSSDINTVRRRYQAQLAERGLCTYRGMLRSKQFTQTFKAYYGAEFLHGFQHELDEHDEQNWLIRLVRHTKGVQPPLRHLLLINFLQFSAEEFFKLPEQSYPFTKGKWLCLNSTCQYFHQPVIQEYDIRYDAHNGNPIGIFSCPYCEFTYQRTGPDTSSEDQFRIGRVKLYGSVWDETLKRLWEDSTLSLLEVAEKLGFDWRTVQKQAVRLNLSYPRSGPTIRSSNLLVSPLQAPELSRTISPDKLESYRQEWLAIRQSNPEAKRRQLQHNFRRVYTWLYRNDLEWLEDHLPVHKVRKSPSSYGVNWEQRDAQLVEQVKLSAEKLKKVSDRPVRITISSLGRDVGQIALLQHKLEKLPLTAEAIAELVETHEQFAIRRIWWAADYFRAEGICPTRTQLLLKACVSLAIRLKPEVSSTITNALNSLELI